MIRDESKFKSFRLRLLIVISFVVILQLTAFLVDTKYEEGGGTGIEKNGNVLSFISSKLNIGIHTRSHDDGITNTRTSTTTSSNLKSKKGKTILNSTNSTNTDHNTLIKETKSTEKQINHYQPFNQTNPHENSWCPTAKCYNSPMCSPCNRRFLFIIATGRSGSTTLLKMFNKLPNVRLSGENWNALFEASKLATFFSSDKNRQHFFYNQKTIDEGQFHHEKVEEGPFAHNAFPLGSMGCVMQSFMRHIDPPDYSVDALPYYDPVEEANTILGAKIIRIPNGNWGPEKAAQFFQENFPCARFIINIRSDEEAQLNSISSAFGVDLSNEEKKEKKKENIEQSNQFLFKLHEELGKKSSMFIDMSQWKDDVEILNKVVKWLGFQDCAFDAIVHENHDNYGRDFETEIHLGDKCRIGTS